MPAPLCLSASAVVGHCLACHGPMERGAVECGLDLAAEGGGAEHDGDTDEGRGINPYSMAVAPERPGLENGVFMSALLMTLVPSAALVLCG